MSGLPNPNTLQASQNNVNQAPQGPDHLATGQEKQLKINTTRDALSKTIDLMNNADKTGWSADRTAAFDDLFALKANIDRPDGEITREVKLQITDSNGRKVEKTIQEGPPSNEAISFLESISATDPNYAEAQTYLAALKENSTKSVDLEQRRFPDDKDEWIKARIDREVADRTSRTPPDPRLKDSAGIDKSPAEIRADVAQYLADRNEIILPELTQAEHEAVIKQEQRLEVARQSSLLASYVPDLARELMEGVAQKKDPKEVVLNEGDKILDNVGGSYRDEQRAAAADTLEAMYILQVINLKRKVQFAPVKAEIADLQKKIAEVKRKRGSLANPPQGNAVTGMATRWATDQQTNAVLYSEKDLRERPALVLNDYIEKVVSNASVPAIDDKGKAIEDGDGRPIMLNVRKVFLDRFEADRKAAAFVNAQARLGVTTGGTATPEQLAKAEAEATEEAKKAKNSLEHNLKLQNVVRKVGAISGPGALIALMMFGKMFKSLAMNLAGVDQQQQQG